VLESAYYEEQVEKETRKVLRFKSDIAPIKAAVFPLLNRDELTGSSEAPHPSSSTIRPAV